MSQSPKKTKKPLAPVNPTLWQDWLHSRGVGIELVTDRARAEEVVRQAAASRTPIAFDLETTAPGGQGLNAHLAAIRLAQLYDGGATVYVLDIPAIGDPLVLAPLADVRVVAFAAGFEAKILLSHGMAFAELDDAAIAAGLRLDRDKHGRGDLATLSSMCAGIGSPGGADKKRMQTSDFSGPLEAEQIAYAAFDVVATLALWLACQPDIRRSGRAYETARGAILATARMELTGLWFDRKGHAWISDEWAKIKEAEDAKYATMTDPLTADQRKVLVATCGELPDKISEARGRKIEQALQVTLSAEALAAWPRTPEGKLALTWLKPTQRAKLAERLVRELPPDVLRRWPRTPTGELALGARKLKSAGLATAAPVLVQYLRANGLSTLVSTFGHPLAELVNPGSDRLHFSLRIAGARTGRYTSSKPNGQNMPAGPFRRIFAAPPGYVMLSCDYAAVELRVAALLAGESSLLRVFREHPLLDDGHTRNPKGDPHVQLSTALRLPYDPKYRLAKNLNYGTLYGAGPPTFSSYAGITIADADIYLASWRSVRPHLVKWQKDTISNVEMTGRSRTMQGRWVNCAVPEKRVNGQLVRPGFTSVTRGMNVPVQGSAAEAMLLAVAKVDAALRAEWLDARLCVTVHDELVVEAAEEDADRAAEIMAEGMRAGFREVFAHLKGFEDVARYVVGGVERGPTWGGPRFDPAALSDEDRATLFKGLDELIEIVTAPEDDDEDEEEEEGDDEAEVEAESEVPPLAAKAAGDDLDLPDFLDRRKRT